MRDKKPSAFRRGVSVLGKLFVGTRKGPSGESVRHLRRVQKRLGVRFTDLSLLEQALTHRSYSHVTSQTRNDSNERMEFLGDSVLGLAVSQFLYLQFPDRSEGALSKMKSLLVSRKVLSGIARDIGLGEHLLLSGEESEMGGRDRASILADSFEGVIGSVYLDQGYRAANQFIQRSLLSRIHEILKDDDHTNFKSLLQEYVQSKRLSHPVYRVRKEEGPEHEKEFAVDVVVKGEIWGTGRGKSKKDAEQNAARAALEKRQGRSAKPRGRAGAAEAGGSRDRGRRRAEPARAEPLAESERAKPERAKPERARPARAEPARGAREEKAATEETPSTPRARVRRRGRGDVVDVETSAKDRGDHGIVASREKLRERRQVEADERRQKERERRDQRRSAGPAEDRVEAGADSGGRRGRSSQETGAEDRERPRRRRRRRRSGGEAAVAAGGVESGRPADAPEAAVRERSEERDVARAGERPKAVEGTEERAQELRQRWDTTEKVEARGTTEAVRESEARERPERGPRAPVERERSSVREEAPAAEAPTGFVRRRKRRETRPHVDSDRTAGKARKEPQPEGSAAGDAPAVQVPSGDIRTGEVPSGGPSAGDAGAERGRTEHVRTEEDVRAEDARTEDVRTEDVRTEDVPTGGRTEDRTGAAPSGDAGDAGGPPVPDPGDSVKTTAEPGGSADSGFTRRKKRHVRGLRRR